MINLFQAITHLKVKNAKSSKTVAVKRSTVILLQSLLQG